MELKFAIYRRISANFSKFDPDNYFLLREIFPINSGSLKLKTAKYQDKAFYRTELDGDLIFKNYDQHTDYTWFIDNWDDPDLRCTHIILKIFQTCEGEESEIYRGFLNYKTIDRDRCTITMETEVFDDYSEIFFNWNTEYNALQCESTQLTINTQSRLNFYFLYSDAAPSTGVFPTTLALYMDYGANWTLWRIIHAYIPGDPTYGHDWDDKNAWELGYNWAAYYAAEIVDMPYGQAPTGADWVAIESGATFVKYARPWASSTDVDWSCVASNQFRFNQLCDDLGEPMPYDLTHKGYIRNACNNQYAQVFNTPCTYNVFVADTQNLRAYYQEYTTDRGRRMNDVLACFLDQYDMQRGTLFFGGTTTGIGDPRPTTC